MSNKEEPLSEEQEAELESAFKPIVKNTIDKIYSPLSWCWPTTIVLLLARWILGSAGYYYMPFWLATVFLWAPVAIIIGLTSFFILLFYLISLFSAWHKFMENMVFYFRLGFRNSATKDKDEPKEESEDDETL